MFLTNAPQVTASSFCERQTRSKPFRSVWGTTRQVKANKHNFLSTSSALFPPAPGMHTSNTDRFHLQDCCGSREVGMGPGENATRISSWDSASFFFFCWLGIYLVAINLWLISRVPRKLILPVFASLFIVFIEGWALGVPHSTISQAS